ncbi:MAG: hypothetical protein Q8919_01050, partial [Bacteroidota bacterium]|nr:hypothetical protein [Bacteroidota bacterium]
MKISQTFPFIKGKFYSVRLSTDTGPDSVGGELRGLKKGERYIMVCQYRGTEEYLFFIEGRCFKVDQKDEIHSMIGNIIAEHEWFRSKGNFGLRK